MRTELAGALARIEGRFGTRAIARAGVAERRQHLRRFATGTSLDRITDGGIATGEPVAFVGRGSVGKVSLALRAAAGAQREGGMIAWIDPSASCDAFAAARAGVDLDRLVVVRARSRDEVLVAASAALRSEGFRLAVVDVGGSLVPPAVALDDLAPLLPLVRGSPAALLVLAEDRGSRVALPTFTFERISWDRRFGRTAGWSFAVSRAHASERAVFGVVSLAGELADLGCVASAAFAEAVS